MIDYALSDSSSDDSDSEIRTVRHRQFRQRINFTNFHEFEFKERFRLRTHEAELVLRWIGARLINTNKNMALSPKQQLLVALHWLGNGSQYHGIGDMHGISKATVCRALRRVVCAIIDLMFQEVVRWPDDVSNLAMEFMRKGGFPSVAGCADGTLIQILAPTQNEGAFVDRYGFHSLNSLMVCGPDLSFYYVSARWPGSVHDSRIMQNSTLYQNFESGWRPFPGAVILGDSAYAVRSWLIKPIHVNPHSAVESRFNAALKSTRRLIENAYGVLKQRFPCLSLLRVNPEYAGRIIMACAAIHNIATKDDFEPPPIQPMEDDNTGVYEPTQAAADRIQELMEYFS